jgi:hypothetical protein
LIDLKKETAKRLSDGLGMDENLTFRLFTDGLIDERTAKKFLVRDEYQKINPPNGQKNEVKVNLADKFCVSFETVNLYIKKSS